MRPRVKVAVTAAAVIAALVLAVATGVGTPVRKVSTSSYVANDSHVHLTNYIQEGLELEELLAVMGDKVGRATVFGIPVTQMWSHRVDGSDAPLYYLDSDADLYYYSFTDADIAMSYLALPADKRGRFDPMITGFNPADMYAADHVRRVLETFPGVFVGIGEFSIHKEFVTSKVAGEPPSLADPALDRLFSFAGEVGLVVLVHCDADTPFPKPGAQPAYWAPLLELFRRHPKTTFIWAHVGLGRVVRPFDAMRDLAAKMLDDPTLKHVHFDLSWSETAKYLLARPDSPDRVAELVRKHPDRFLFGTDEVAPTNQDDYLRVLRMYDPLWARLSPDVIAQVRKGNYERLFDSARRKVRAWEGTHRREPESPQERAHRP